jgi:hypothetical protein
MLSHACLHSFYIPLYADYNCSDRLRFNTKNLMSRENLFPQTRRASVGAEEVGESAARIQT